jgi:hypothetical protein
MRVRGKPTHIRADLRHNDLSAQLADPRNGAQALDGVTKAGEPDIDLLINFCDASIKRVDLLQMQTKQETMVAFDPSTRASRSVSADARTFQCASAASLAGSVSPSINA